MQDAVEKMILDSLKRIETRTDEINNNLQKNIVENTAKFAELKADIKRLDKDVDSLHNVHRSCKEERKERDKDFDGINKKVKLVTLLWAGLVGLGSAVVIVLQILKFFGV